MLLPALGTSLLTAADAFYYAIPILGKMHIFQRYLAFSQFLFAILIAALATIIGRYASSAAKRVATYLAIFVWLVVAVLFLVLQPAPANASDPLIVELFLMATTAVALAVAPPTFAFLVASCFPL